MTLVLIHSYAFSCYQGVGGASDKRVTSTAPSVLGGITMKEFIEFVRTHQALMWPAFQMQLALQSHIMNAAFWEVWVCSMCHAPAYGKTVQTYYMRLPVCQMGTPLGGTALYCTR